MKLHLNKTSIQSITFFDFYYITGLTQQKKPRSKWYPEETITDADNTDDLALLSNRPAQAECLLHCLEEVTRSIYFYVNIDKTEFMHFDGAISPLNDNTLKSNHFPFIGSSIPSTESNVNIHINCYQKIIDHLKL